MPPRKSPQAKNTNPDNSSEKQRDEPENDESVPEEDDRSSSPGTLSGVELAALRKKLTEKYH